MSTIKEELDSFYQFASAHVNDDESDLSMDELYQLWRLKNPTPEEFADCVAKLKAAYADLQAGEQAIPIREALRETYKRHGIVIDE